MKHNERIQAVRDGSDYKAPLRAINHEVEGLVHCALIVRANETNLSPETRALDAIGTQVERELRQRAEMIVVLTERLQVVEADLVACKRDLADYLALNPQKAGEREELVLSEDMQRPPRDIPALPQISGGGQTV